MPPSVPARRSALALAAGLLALVSVWLADAAPARAQVFGTEWFKGKVEDLLSGGGIDVTIGELEGPLPGAVTVRDVTVADPQGVFLRIPRATLDWKPLALVRGRFTMEELSAENAELLRAPDLPDVPEEEERQPQGFDFGVLENVRIDTLDLQNISLGESILGEAMVLSAEGMLGPTEEGGVRADLVVERVDERGGRAAILAEVSPGQELTLDVQAAEPAGGIIARMLDLPGLPPVQVVLEGSGPAAQWSGELSAVAEDLAQIAGDVTLGLPEPGRWTAGADVTATVTEQAPEAWQELVRQGLDLAVNAGGTEAGAVTVSSLTARTDAYSLTGEGVSLGPLGELDGSVTLETENAEALSALVELPFASGAVTVSLDGALQEPEAIVDAVLRQVESGTGVIETIEGRFQVTADGPVTDPATPITLSGGASLNGLPEPAPDERAEIAVDATVNRAAQRLAVRLLEVWSDTLTASADLTADLEAMTAEGTVTATAEQLEPLAALAGLEVEGAGQVRAVFDRATAEGAVEGDVAISLDSLQWGNATYAALIGDHLDVAADLRRGAEGAVQVENLTIDSGGINGGARAALPADMETIDAAFAIQVPEVSAVSPELAGSVSLGGGVSGPLAAPDVEVTATSPSLTAAGTTLTDVALDLTALGLDAEGASGRLDLEAEGPDGAPVRLSTAYEAPGWQRVALSDVQALAAGIDLGGALQVVLDPLAIEGRLDGQVQSWDALGGFAGMPLNGEGGQLSVTLNSTDGVQRAAAEVTVDRIALPQEGADVADVVVEAEATRLFTEPTATATLTTGAGSAAGRTWETARVALDGGAETGTVTASLTGPTDLEAEARYDLPAQEIVLTALSVEDGETGLGGAITQPATVSFGEALAVRDLRLALAEQGVVALDAALGPQRVDIDMAVDNLPLALAEPFIEGPVPTGDLQARASIQGAPSNPTGTITASIPDLAIPDAEVAGLALDLTGDLRNERLDLRVALDGLEAEEAVATASLPVAFSAQGIPSLPETQPIEALVRWRGRVNDLWNLVPVVGHRLYGQGFVTAGVTGTLAEPELTADARITDGRYENLEYGTVLTNLRLEASRGAGGTVQVALTGDDAARGDLRMEATATLTDDGDLVIEADGGLTRATLVRRDDVRVTISGDLGFSGPLNGGAFTADLVVDNGLFRLVNTLGGGVRTLDVVEEGSGRQPLILAPEEVEAAEAEAEAAAPVVVGLDVSVTIPNRFYVRGRGLESEWSGALRVTGTSDAPTLVGQLQVVRGQFDLIGNNFFFEEGVIEFPGGRRIEPVLNITAVSEAAGDVTAIIRVTGTGSDPEIEMTSRPALPEDEVMARVLFGRGLQDLGPVEALQVANAVRVLTGFGGGGPGITEVIAGTLGVDTIRVGGGAEGPALEVGKYLTEDIYVGVEQGITSESTGVNVEVQLTPSISMEGKTTGRGSEVGVNWQKDY